MPSLLGGATWRCWMKMHPNYVPLSIRIWASCGFSMASQSSSAELQSLNASHDKEVERRLLWPTEKWNQTCSVINVRLTCSKLEEKKKTKKKPTPSFISCDPCGCLPWDHLFRCLYELACGHLSVKLWLQDLSSPLQVFCTTWSTDSHCLCSQN